MFLPRRFLGCAGRPDLFATRPPAISAAFILFLLAALTVPIKRAEADLKLGGVDYRSLESVAGYFGMKRSWVTTGKKLALSSEWTRLEFEPDRRYFLINGRKVYLGHPLHHHRSDLYLSRGDFEKTLKPLLTPRAFSPVPKLYRIVIDPGHGGKDPGTQNNSQGLIEKAVVLDISQKLQKILSKQGYQVILTRQSDKFIDLAKRPAMANSRSADLFISVHANAAGSSKVQGIETFVFTPQNQPSTRNSQIQSADRKAYPGNRFDPWNTLLGFYVQREVVTELKAGDRGLKRARMAVLKTLNCPGLLVETGFVTNTAEAGKLKTATYRQKMAQAIASGILQYQKTLNRLRGK